MKNIKFHIVDCSNNEIIETVEQPVYEFFKEEKRESPYSRKNNKLKVTITKDGIPMDNKKDAKGKNQKEYKQNVNKNDKKDVNNSFEEKNKQPEVDQKPEEIVVEQPKQDITIEESSVDDSNILDRLLDTDDMFKNSIQQAQSSDLLLGINLNQEILKEETEIIEDVVVEQTIEETDQKEEQQYQDNLQQQKLEDLINEINDDSINPDKWMKKESAISDYSSKMKRNKGGKKKKKNGYKWNKKDYDYDDDQYLNYEKIRKNNKGVEF